MIINRRRSHTDYLKALYGITSLRKGNGRRKDGVPKREYVRVGKKGAKNHTAEGESIGVLMEISNCKI